MKAKLVGSMPVGAWIYEIKFDGYRALGLRAGGETRILSRNEKDLGSKFPAVRDSIAALNVQDAMQRIFSSATRRELLGKHLKVAAAAVS
jgi:bifunctional non-homologous end joining protein LigD